MAYCTNCGNEISATEAFCPSCGARNEPASAPSPGSDTPAAEGVQLRPLGIGEIVDVGIRIYRDNALTLFKIVAIVVVPVQILAALVQASTLPEGLDTGFPMTPVETDPTTQELPFDFSDLWTFLAGSLVVGILSFLASQLATAASLKAVSDAYLGREPDAESSLRFALGRLGSLVWLAILYAVLIGLGFLLCIVPGVYLLVAWAVAIPVLLTEDHRGWEALRRSRELVKGRWWYVLGALAIAYILAFIANAIIAGIFEFAIPGSSGSLVVAFFSSALGGAIASVLTTPFIAGIIAVVYFDLRVRKEGFDLELLARSIGSGPPTGGAFGGPPGPAGGAGPTEPAGGAFPDSGQDDRPSGALGAPPDETPPTDRPKPQWKPPDPDGPAWESH